MSSTIYIKKLNRKQDKGMAVSQPVYANNILAHIVSRNDCSRNTNTMTKIAANNIFLLIYLVFSTSSQTHTLIKPLRTIYIIHKKP